MKLLKGFTMIELLVIVGVIALVGGIGYTAWKSISQGSETSKSATVVVPPDQAASAIRSASDLDREAKKLDALDVEASELDEAERQADV